MVDACFVCVIRLSTWPAGQAFTYATPDTVLGEGDILVVAGDSNDAESFAHLTA